MGCLSKILSQASLFWESGASLSGRLAAGIVFLILTGVGIAADIGLVLYGIKRPVRLSDLAGQIAFRALPWQIVLLFFSMASVFYFLASWGYVLLFPGGEIAPHTVIFETLFFHLPVLGLLGLLLHKNGIQGKEWFGLYWKKAPASLGLSIFFYVASLPLLWFYSALYQLVLQQFGHDFYLQDIAQILTAPASWTVRAALFFIVIIVAPMFEEIVFRGILLPFFVHRVGLMPGIALVSVFFAGIHGHLPSLLPLFLLSVLFSLAYARTLSLWVPIGMHTAFNGITVVWLLFLG